MPPRVKSASATKRANLVPQVPPDLTAVAANPGGATASALEAAKKYTGDFAAAANGKNVLAGTALAAGGGLLAYQLGRLARPPRKPAGFAADPLRMGATKIAAEKRAFDVVNDAVMPAATALGAGFKSAVNVVTPSTDAVSNNRFMLPAVMGVPLAAMGAVAAKRKMDQSYGVDPQQQQVAEARKQFQAAMSRQLSMNKAAAEAAEPLSAELAACVAFADGLEKQADMLGNAADSSAASWYLPAAGLTALASGIASYKVNKKLDPDRIKAEAAKDAYRRLRVAKPPVVQATTVGPGETAESVSALSDPGTMVVPFQMPNMRKAAELIDTLNPLQKTAALGLCLAAHGQFPPDKLDVLGRVLEQAFPAGFDKSAEAYDDYAGGFAGMAPEAQKQFVSQLNPESLQGPLGWGDKAKLLMSGFDKNNPATYPAGMKAMQGVAQGNPAFAAALRQQVNGLQQSGKLPPLAAAGTVAPAVEAAAPAGPPNPQDPGLGQQVMGMMRSMHPLQALSLVAGLGGVVSGNTMPGILMLGLGLFGNQLFGMVPGLKDMPNIGQLVDKVSGMMSGNADPAQAAAAASPSPAGAGQSAVTGPEGPAAPNQVGAGGVNAPPAAPASAAPTGPTTPPPASDPLLGRTTVPPAPSQGLMNAVRPQSAPTEGEGRHLQPIADAPPPAPAQSPAGQPAPAPAATPPPSPGMQQMQGAAGKPPTPPPAAAGPVAKLTPNGGLGAGMNATAGAAMGAPKPPMPSTVSGYGAPAKLPKFS